MSEDFYDDDFESDDDAKKTQNRISDLQPIVEVPSDLDSARSTSEPSETQRTEASDRSENDDDDDDDISEDDADREENSSTARSQPSSARRRKRVKNGKYGVIDMTPPDKLLRKSEKRAARYSKHPKKYEQAIQEYVKCAAYARIVYGDGHWKLANAYANLAQAYYDLRNFYLQCQLHSEAAKSIMMSSVQLSSSSTDKPRILHVLINIYYNLGRSLTQLKKYSEAEQSLSKCEKLAKERSKMSSVSDTDVDEWSIKIFTSIARLNARQRKFAVAQSYFEKVLDVIEQTQGKDSKDLIPVYQSLGKVEQSKGDHADHERAIEHFLQAHSVADANYKEGSVEIAETARTLANAYMQVGIENALTSAESYLNECLAIYQTQYGPFHKTTIEVQDELARLMIKDERYEEGVNMLKSTIDAKKEVYGDLCVEIAETWKLIGNVYLAQGDTEKALRSLNKCHNIESSVYGANNKKSKETQRTIDILLANPNLKSKQKKSATEVLAERPRFNSTIQPKSQVGGFKASAY